MPNLAACPKAIILRMIIANAAIISDTADRSWKLKEDDDACQDRWRDQAR